MNILFIDMLVKENKRVNLFCGVVSILGMVPTTAGTLYLTFVTLRREVRISKYSSSKFNGI